jgi:hypothetical protein
MITSALSKKKITIKISCPVFFSFLFNPFRHNEKANHLIQEFLMLALLGGFPLFEATGKVATIQYVTASRNLQTQLALESLEASSVWPDKHCFVVNV